MLSEQELADVIKRMEAIIVAANQSRRRVMGWATSVPVDTDPNNYIDWEWDIVEANEESDDLLLTEQRNAESMIAWARRCLDGDYIFSQADSAQLMRIILAVPGVGPEMIDGKTWPGLVTAYQVVLIGETLDSQRLRALLRDFDRIRMSPAERAKADEAEHAKEQRYRMLFVRAISLHQRASEAKDALAAANADLLAEWPDRRLPDESDWLPF
jgi:hypothetical protein